MITFLQIENKRKRESKMASLCGISIEAYEDYVTRSGVAYSADLYMGGNKIGFFENKGDGGMTHIFVEKEFREKFAQAVARYFSLYPAYSQTQEDFIEELIILHENEELYKEIGKGKVMVEIYRYDRMTPADEKEWKSFDDLDPKIYLLDDESHITYLLGKLEKENQKPSHYYVYRKISDFSR
jgi:hypothetical protein